MITTTMKRLTLVLSPLVLAACQHQEAMAEPTVGYRSEASLIFLAGQGEQFCKSKATLDSTRLVDVYKVLWLNRESFEFFIFSISKLAVDEIELGIVSPTLCSERGAEVALTSLKQYFGVTSFGEPEPAILLETEPYLDRLGMRGFNFGTILEEARLNDCIYVRDTEAEKNFPEPSIRPDNIPFIRYTLGLPLAYFTAEQEREYFIFDGGCEYSSEFVDLIDYVLQLNSDSELGG